MQWSKTRSARYLRGPSQVFCGEAENSTIMSKIRRILGTTSPVSHISLSRQMRLGVPVTSDISIDEQYLWVANRRLSSLITFALEVAVDAASTDEERMYVDKLKDWDEKEHWPGCGFDLQKRFPTVDEKKFWSRCFFNVARRIFRR